MDNGDNALNESASMEVPRTVMANLSALSSRLVADTWWRLASQHINAAVHPRMLGSFPARDASIPGGSATWASGIPTYAASRRMPGVNLRYQSLGSIVR